jgi:hypothetical protein
LQPSAACSFSAYGLRNVLFSAVAVAKLKAHPVLPGEIATTSIIQKIEKTACLVQMTGV